MKGLLLAVAVGVLALTGCGAQGTSVGPSGDVLPNDNKVYGNVQKIVIDGVECVLYEAHTYDGGGAISCNWPTQEATP